MQTAKFQIDNVAVDLVIEMRVPVFRSKIRGAEFDPRIVRRRFIQPRHAQFGKLRIGELPVIAKKGRDTFIEMFRAATTVLFDRCVE